MKYEKPKIEITRIYNQDDVAVLGTGSTSSVTSGWSNLYKFSDM